MRRVIWLTILVGLLAAMLAGCASTSVIGGDNSGSAFSDHPQPKEETFHGCPPEGDGGDTQLNVLKNRVDDAQFHDVALSDLLQLQWPQSIERSYRENWSTADRAAIQQYEGAPIRTTGYILNVKHEGTESTNCHAVDYRDFHVWLAMNAGDDRSKAMVIEVTPRVRDMRPGWTDEVLSQLHGQQVRVSGWLLMDQEHPEQLGQTRGTLWEIHPIIHLEVHQNGGWTSIDG